MRLRAWVIVTSFGGMESSQRKGTDALTAHVPPDPGAGQGRGADFPEEEGGLRASIIIPTLQEEKRLASLLDVLGDDRRSHHRFEVIISDGGSTDRTIAIARKMADRTVVHAGPERQTIAAGRNAGAKEARGRVLLFMNADVTLPDDVDGFLSAVLAAAEGAGAATCRVGVHPEEATPIDRLILGACNVLFCGMNHIGMGMGRGECHAVRADVFSTVGAYDERLAAGEDFDLFRRIALYGRRSGEASIKYLWEWTLWEDPRRYRQIGYPRVLAAWFRNSVYVTLLGRSYSSSWEPVR